MVLGPGGTSARSQLTGEQDTAAFLCGSRPETLQAQAHRMRLAGTNGKRGFKWLQRAAAAHRTLADQLQNRVDDEAQHQERRTANLLINFGAA